MSRVASVRKYGRATTKPRAQRLFAELSQNPIKTKPNDENPIDLLTEQLGLVSLNGGSQQVEDPQIVSVGDGVESGGELWSNQTSDESSYHDSSQSSVDGLRVLTWDDVCPFGDRILKIAEASYAEVYRITNERGTSIIKVIRLESPIKPQTKAQQKSGLIDEVPHYQNDLVGELKISEWLADIPGFVVYKERYIVRGKAPKSLLETHQAFQRKAKRADPGRVQFYPSPSRYLDETSFLVVELGDAGVALEDFELTSSSDLWDIFFHTAIALARAEDLVKFEHRDLHEGNLCIRYTGKRSLRPETALGKFGHSGLDITILDYGLSRAEDVDGECDDVGPVAFDLEKDLSIFTSTHAAQCRVYRQMRSFLMQGDRVCLPPNSHNKPYDSGVDGPISWSSYHPYTNVLWLAYIYRYLVSHFVGEPRELGHFKRISKELWSHLNPDAPSEILSFSAAGDVVKFAVEAGWITEDQLVGERSQVGDDWDAASVAYNESIIEVSVMEAEDAHLRRSPRRRK